MRDPDATRTEVQRRTRTRRTIPKAPPPAAAKSVRDSTEGGRSPASPPPPRRSEPRRGGAADTFAEPGKHTTRPVDIHRINRAAARDEYATRPVPERQLALRDAKGKGDDWSRAITKLHQDRTRSQHYVDQATAWLTHPHASEDQAGEDITKGLRVMRHLAERQQQERESKAARDSLGHALSFGKVTADSIAHTAEVLGRAPAAEHHGTLAGVGHLLSKIGANVKREVGLGSSVSVPTSPNGAGPQADTVVKGALDATSKALEQTTRVSSASAGAALAGVKGKNIIKGAASGFVHNDKSYRQVAEALGLHGAPAAIVGLVGDVALDPTTYATLGMKAPAEAAELTARASMARKYGGAIKKAAKAGDEAEVRRIHEQWQRELGDAIEHARKLEGEQRGVQVGLRLPGGRGVSTKGRISAKAGRVVGAPGRAAQQTRTVNDTLRRFSPKSRPIDVTRGEWEEFRQANRQAEALGNRVAREGADVARVVRSVVKGKSQTAHVRAIVDAIEAGDVASLSPRLRAAAERLTNFTDDVAQRFEALTGRPLQLAETVLPKADVDEASKLLRQLMDARLRSAQAGVSRAERAVGAARVRNDTLRKFGDPRRDPAVREQEQAVTAADHAVRRAADALSRARRTEAEAIGAARVSEVRDAPTVRRARADLAAAQRVLERLQQRTASLGEDVAHGTGRLEGAEALRQRQVAGRIRATESTRARLAARAERAEGADRARLRTQMEAVDRRLADLRTSLADGERAPSLKLTEQDATHAAMRRQVEQQQAHVSDLEKQLDAELARTAGVDPKVADRLRGAQHAAEEAQVAHLSARATAKLHRRLLDEAIVGAERVTARDAEYAGRRDARLVEAQQRLADTEGLIERVVTGGRPLDVDEERRLVEMMGVGLDALNADKLVSVMGQRVDDFLERVATGKEGPEWDELRDALNAQSFHAQKATDLRKAGNLAGAAAARTEARKASELIERYRPVLHDAAARGAEGEDFLTGAGARLRELVDRMGMLAEKDPPAGYVPRQLDEFLRATFDPAARRRLGTDGAAKAKAGPEVARVRRERMAELRKETDAYSEDLPLLTTLYGTKMGRRMASISLHRATLARFAQPATPAALRDIESLSLMHVDGDGMLSLVDNPRDVAAYGREAEAIERRAAESGEPATFDHVLVPTPIAHELAGSLRQLDNAPLLEKYDRLLRAWKMASTILRPGFFATTIVGNTWQQFLADAGPRDWMRAWGALAELRTSTAAARTVDEVARRHRLLSKLVPAGSHVTPDGPRTLAELVEEAADSGAARIGSRLSAPVDLSLERQSALRAQGSATDWLGQLAEDLDDATRLTLYVRGRTKLGLSVEQATKYSLSNMVDYTSLSRFEQTFMRRLVPFYTYTSRNLPLQVRRILARPGKLATFEKVREALADESGLGRDWARGLRQEDQERMLVAVPGLTFLGNQAFADLRLPVEDIAPVLQLGEGASGAGRFAERELANVGPAKLPLEMALGRRLDYDRPFDEGAPPPAGALLRAAGMTKGEYVDPKTGRTYEGASSRLDYLLRSLGGSLGATALNQGRQVPDRSGVPNKMRTAAGFLGGFGITAPAPEEAQRAAIGDLLHKLYVKRDDMAHRPGQGLGSEASYALSDLIHALSDQKTEVEAKLGYPDAVAQMPALRERYMQRLLNPPGTPRMRALDHRIRAILDAHPVPQRAAR